MSIAITWSIPDRRPTDHLRTGPVEDLERVTYGLVAQGAEMCMIFVRQNPFATPLREGM